MSADLENLIALVVDDNHYQRGISIDLLRTMGFGRALGADSVTEAWDQIHRIKPDVILVEWLKSGDSLDFIRRLRTSEETPNRAVSLFMLSNSGSGADVQIAREAGADAYLRKPISLMALQSRVKKVIANPQPFVVTATYVGPCRRRRQDAAYAGPHRRLDDPAPASVTVDEDELNLKAELARARVAALEACALLLKPGDAAAARAVFKAVQDLADVAKQIGDPNLAFGASEMARYLQAQGATERLDPEVVRTHVAALHQLAHLPPGLAKERESVAQSLKKMVDKKLRSNAA
jgi:DNA-binding response OmpR family regulator